MESPPYNPMIELSREIIVAVREFYGLDVKKINESVDAIEEWGMKQDHLVEAFPYLNRHMLERFLILGKGSIERTKHIIDKILTVRGMLPEFVQHDPTKLLKEYSDFVDNILIVPMHKLNPLDNTRTFVFRLQNENFEDIDMLQITQFCCFILEMKMNTGYVFSVRLLFDFKHVKTNVITKFNPVVLKKFETMFVGAYKVRVKGIHMVNTPSFLNTIINIGKQIISDKIARRVYSHDSYEDLYRVIPKEVLPKEYGGDLETCREFADKWKNYFKREDAKQFIENGRKLISNETRRSTIKFNEEYMGIPGSFKRLTVD